MEEEMATHSSVLAWRIPGTGEPGGLPSMGLHRVGHDWSALAAAAVRGQTDIMCLQMHWVYIRRLTFAKSALNNLNIRETLNWEIFYKLACTFQKV